MFECVECGTKINLDDIEGERIECHCCGIELEIVGDTIRGLQLGPSEE